ncbi:MAG TPA: diacylglycerol kinase family protein [Actinomycetota bacterium]|jgi:YegS/Rv2252/BmrU family lipid kinase|nr:diacylglycerol kinase family protein [Actinomycetota bacterium]
MTAACVAHVGSAAWDRLPEALRLLRGRFGRVPVYPASDPGDTETLTAELAAEVDVLVVFGGDGTVHEVANGLPLAGDDPLVALLPGGTGNDLARAIGIPPDPVAAAAELAGARPRALDLLECGTRRAANGVNAGFAAAATDTLSRPLKKTLGPAAYVVGGIRAGVRPPTWPTRVEVDGRVVSGDALAVVVGNGGSFGGGRWLIPDADVGDGLLDVLFVPAGASKAKLARHLAKDRRLPGDLPRLRGPSATLVTDMPCRLDGEPAPTPGSVTVIPAAWRLLAPP